MRRILSLLLFCATFALPAARLHAQAAPSPDAAPQGALGDPNGALPFLSASVRMLIQLLCASPRHAAGAVAVCQGLLAPARVMPPSGAPAQMPRTIAHARSPAITVWLVPSVMSVKRVRLLR